MFVSVDMDKLVFLHKHHDHDTLSGLAFLEAPDRTVSIESTQIGNFLKGMSRLDLCLLYKNTTTGFLVHQETGILRWQLGQLVESMKPTLALLDEVQTQVAAVEDDLHKGAAYKYVLGAKVPAKGQELFPLQAKPLSEKVLETVAAKIEAAPPIPPAPPVRPTRVAPEQAAKAAPTERKGGPKVAVRPIVRAACDKAWEAAGQPSDKAQLKAMTTLLIPALEADGYHPTTIRIKISEWIKEKAL